MGSSKRRDSSDTDYQLPFKKLKGSFLVFPPPNYLNHLEKI
ncbi:hypothetical protein CHCC14819_3788 [Bacillus licheniformis]|nr:hypothetical protein CHCC14819_3788 [Bacillus licheniformis]